MSESLSISPLDPVVVTQDLPELDLHAGDLGTVVEVLGSEAFEVEFCDTDGVTYGLHTLRAAQLLPLRAHGQPFRFRSHAA